MKDEINYAPDSGLHADLSHFPMSKTHILNFIALSIKCKGYPLCPEPLHWCCLGPGGRHRWRSHWWETTEMFTRGGGNACGWLLSPHLHLALDNQFGGVRAWGSLTIEDQIFIPIQRRHVHLKNGCISLHWYWWQLGENKEVKFEAQEAFTISSRAENWRQPHREM